MKLVCAVLLLCCFVLLAVRSGAIPVMTAAEAADAGTALSGLPPPAETDRTATNSPEPASSPMPVVTLEPVSTPEPAAEEDPEAAPTPRIVSTTITAEEVLDNDTYFDADPDELLAEGFSLPLDSEGYQVLIVHTHATEAYAPTPDDPYEQEEDCRTTDPAHSVIRVGEALAEALSAYGLNVLHDTELHDYPSYNGSYARSGETIEAYLEEYPGIRIVIDLHRDALEDDDTVYRTDAGIEGVDAAQLMFVMGTDENLEHPAWRENLTLALTLQNAVAERWPTLMRPVVLCAYRYNQQLTTGSLLLEVGTSGNTLAEAVTAAELFAEAVGPLLASWIF